MYYFGENSAITKVLKTQSRAFWFGMRALNGKDAGVHYETNLGKVTNTKKKYFVCGEHKGCFVEEYDRITRDKKSEHFFFVTSKGEFCRYYSESAMFGGNGPSQEVFTFMHSSVAGVREIRAVVKGDKVVDIKDEDREIYHRLNIARCGALANLHALEGKEEKDVSL